MDRINKGHSKNYVSLSEQYTLNTSTSNNGCNGGLFQITKNDIQKNGIPTTKSCPYQSGNGQFPIPCPSNLPDSDFVLLKNKNNLKILVHDPVTSSSNDQVKQLLQIHGPLVTAIYAKTIIT